MQVRDYDLDEQRKNIQVVFDKWNALKERGNAWRGCRRDSNGKIPYEVKRAIRGALDHYPLIDVCRAIGNYALVLFDKQYRWTYAWKIGVFFTVKYEKRKEGEKKWWQFLPHNFCEADYLTKSAAESRRYQRRARTESPPEKLGSVCRKSLKDGFLKLRQEKDKKQDVR